MTKNSRYARLALSLASLLTVAAVVLTPAKAWAIPGMSDVFSHYLQPQDSSTWYGLMLNVLGLAAMVFGVVWPPKTRLVARIVGPFIFVYMIWDQIFRKLGKLDLLSVGWSLFWEYIWWVLGYALLNWLFPGFLAKLIGWVQSLASSGLEYGQKKFADAKKFQVFMDLLNGIAATLTAIFLSYLVNNRELSGPYYYAPSIPPFAWAGFLIYWMVKHKGKLPKWLEFKEAPPPAVDEHGHPIAPAAGHGTTPAAGGGHGTATTTPAAAPHAAPATAPHAATAPAAAPAAAGGHGTATGAPAAAASAARPRPAPAGTTAWCAPALSWGGYPKRGKRR